MEAWLKHALDAFFHAYAAGDEQAFLALQAPEMTFFGSLIRSTVRGPGSTLGVFKAMRESVGLRLITPLETFGDGPELAVLTRFEGEGGHPVTEAVLGFRFDEDHRLSRLAAYWDPGAFLQAKGGGEVAVRERLEDKDPRVQRILGAYFASFNAGDEPAHYRVIHPDLDFFGSLSRVRSQGMASAQGIFRAVRGSLGITHFTPLRHFGDWPELAVLLDMAHPQRGLSARSLALFRFGEDERIRELSVLWNPLPFLKRAQGA